MKDNFLSLGGHRAKDFFVTLLNDTLTQVNDHVCCQWVNEWGIYDDQWKETFQG